MKFSADEKCTRYISREHHLYKKKNVLRYVLIHDLQLVVYNSNTTRRDYLPFRSTFVHLRLVEVQLHVFMFLGPCRPLFVLLFLCPLYCLSLFDLRL